MGFMQQRYGPYLVGPHGVLQPLADILKLLMKEELRPKGADKWLFTLAPILSVTAAFAAFATVPWGAETTLFGLLDQPIKLGVPDVNVGVLVVFAITSMGVYGIVLAGWASNSKYSLFGGLRASAQMISYELSYATSLAAVDPARRLPLAPRGRRLAGGLPGSAFIPQWYVFLQPVGFIIYVIAGVAETNRAPFDFPEAEQELVAGYNTEYSSVRFALFPQAEYINMATMSAVATDLYLGGWHGPFLAGVARVDRVPGQGQRDSLRLHLDALDGAALPLRPADVVRLEVAVAGVGDQPARDGGAGALFQCLRRSLFYLLSRARRRSPRRSSSAAQPDVQRHAADRVVRGAGRALHPARCALRGGGADHHLRRRHHGALPVRGDAAQRAAGRRGRVRPHASAAAPGGHAVRRPARRCCSSCELALGADARERARPAGGDAPTPPSSARCASWAACSSPPRVRVRGDVDPDSGGDGRRRGAGAPRRSDA